MSLYNIKMSPARRKLLFSALAAGSLGLTGGVPALQRKAHAANGRVVFATWGGTWEKAWQPAWAIPFKEQTGITVQAATGNTLGRLQAMVDANNTEWDVIEGVPELATIGGSRGLLEKLDFDVIDRSGVLDFPELYTDYSIPQVLFARVMVFNTSLKETPKTWADLWDIERFPGRRAFNAQVQSGALEAALLADGVKPEELYPLDIPRALKKLDEIRDHILWYDSQPQSEQFMRGGQAVMGVIADGRALSIRRTGAPIEIVPEASLLTWSVMGIPKGAANKDNAMQFLNFILTPRSQAAIANEYYYGPVVPAAWDLIPEERHSEVLVSPEVLATGTFQSASYWTDHLEEANEQFQVWKLG